MLGSCHYTPHFHETHQPSPTRRSAHSAITSPLSMAGALWRMWEACRDGLAAHRCYEHLRSKGVPHETALREALGVGCRCSQAAREAAKPLYFAGRA
jgi:hypothetical protein